jgi:hypothetical protein
MAGNSVREADLVPHHVTPPHTFRRFDPVPPPAVVPRRPFTEGESLLRMVIRSTLGVLPAPYVALARITALSGHTDPITAYVAANERHLASPISSQQLAEWHGRFDAGIGQALVSPSSMRSSTWPRGVGFVSTRSERDRRQRTRPERLRTSTTRQEEGRSAAAGRVRPSRRGSRASVRPIDVARRLLHDLARRRYDAAGEVEAGPGWFDRRPIRIRIEHGAVACLQLGGASDIFLRRPR